MPRAARQRPSGRYSPRLASSPPVEVGKLRDLLARGHVDLSAAWFLVHDPVAFHTAAIEGPSALANQHAHANILEGCIDAMHQSMAAKCNEVVPVLSRASALGWYEMQSSSTGEAEWSDRRGPRQVAAGQNLLRYDVLSVTDILGSSQVHP